MIQSTHFLSARQQTICTCVRFASSLVSKKEAGSAPSTNAPLKIEFNSSYLQASGERLAFTSSDFRERLTLIEACLSIGQTRRAQVLFRNLVVGYPTLAEQLVDVHVHNSFLEAFTKSTDNSSFRDALKWFNAFKRSNVGPNVTSYAILVQAALKKDRRDIIRMLVDDMKLTLKESNVTEYDLLNHPIFCEMNFDVLKQHLHIQHDGSIGSSVCMNTHDNRSNVLEDTPLKSSQGRLLPFIQENLRRLYLHDTSQLANDSQLFDLQIQMEQDTCRIGLQRLISQKEMVYEKTGVRMVASDVRRLMDTWHTELIPIIKGEMEKCKQTVRDDLQDYGPFLLLFEKEPEILSAITVTQILRLFSSVPEFVSAIKVANSIGAAVETEFKSKVINSRKYREMLRSNHALSQILMESGNLYSSDVRNEVAKKNDIIGMHNLKDWESSTKTRIGSVLFSLMLDSAKVPVNKDVNSVIQFPHALKYLSNTGKGSVIWEQALNHKQVVREGKKIGAVFLHDAITKRFQDGFSKATGSDVFLVPGLMPMLIPPQPWYSFDKGGYLTIKSYCVRGMTPEIEAYLKESCIKQTMNDLFASLDALGSTSWRINDWLLKHVSQAWNTGEAIAGLPPAISGDVEDQPKPDAFDSDAFVRYKWHKDYRKTKQEYYDKKGLRATENYKLEIAKALSGLKFYFPHNMDFRGRAYPIPPNFNHLGNDLSRALLLFDEPKALGKTGLKWLKIHLANVYGFDKGTFDERLRFVDNNTSKIRASVANPFGNEPDNNWWTKAEKPWLCLAVCKELVDAVDSSSVDEFLSRMPVHQDGSCNGLQHYAALGGDLEGATQVNLCARSDRPNDVYSAVADRVRKLISEDLNLICEEHVNDFEKAKILSLSHPASKQFCATRLGIEKIERKTVKQTVMTSVYGVTFIGAREQVRSRLREKYYPDVFNEEELNMLSLYVTPKIFQALDDMFHGARKIQQWLAFSAREVARSVSSDELNDFLNVKSIRQQKKKSSHDYPATKTKSVKLNRTCSVVWTTPLNLVVVQPYRSEKSTTVQTSLQSFALRNSHIRSPVDVNRQKAAFPPNFIHSLDATHMLMTALACKRQSDPLTFASVHDSYWTHAADVERLRHILKVQFVKLHSQPILKNLREEFIERYGKRKVEIEIAQQCENEPTKTSGQAYRHGSVKVSKSRKYVDISFPDLPARGTFDINEVCQSKYFFS